MTAPVVDTFLTPAQAERALRNDARLGLTSSPKWLSPKWFYDAQGSDLFEQITGLPEYYPSRAERSTRLLLDALGAQGSLREFVPLDVSGNALRAAVAALHVDYPTLAIHGVVADFTEHLGRIPGQTPA